MVFNGQCSRGDSGSFCHGTTADNKHDRPLLLQRCKHRLLKVLRKAFAPGVSPSGKEGQKACKSYLKRTCTNPSCNYWHPPECQNYTSESGFTSGDKCVLRDTEADLEHG